MTKGLYIINLEERVLALEERVQRLEELFGTAALTTDEDEQKVIAVEQKLADIERMVEQAIQKLNTRSILRGTDHDVR